MAARKRVDQQTNAAGTETSDVRDGQTKVDKTEIPEADIRLRAYEIYVERGGVEGLSENDWFQAEKELRDGLKSRGQKA
jgi:Protein of unknown function (DUF2934)